MGVGVKPFCLGLAKTLLSGLNKANSTYVAATSNYFGKFEPLVKSPKNHHFSCLGGHLELPEGKKWVLEVKVAPKYRTQYVCWGQTLLSGTCQNTFIRLEQGKFDLRGSYERLFWKI